MPSFIKPGSECTAKKKTSSCTLSGVQMPGNCEKRKKIIVYRQIPLWEERACGY